VLHVTNYGNVNRTQTRPLLHAILSEREEVVRDVIRWYGSSVPRVCMANTEALYRAVNQGGEGIMRLLMGWTGYFDTAARISGLKRSVFAGQAGIARILIVGYDMRDQRKVYQEALGMAISFGNNETARVFVEFDYSDSAFEAIFKLNFLHALMNDRVDVVRLILESPNVPDSASALLTHALYTTTDSRMMNFILDWLAPHAGVISVLLLLAVSKRNKDIIRTLLHRPRHAAAVDGGHLVSAVLVGDVEIMDLLLGRLDEPDRQLVEMVRQMAVRKYGTDSGIANLLSNFLDQV
jgi:hypothetical protein